jgi:hypothetical protein
VLYLDGRVVSNVSLALVHCVSKIPLHKGIFKFPDGDMYNGEFVNRQANGHAK